MKIGIISDTHGLLRPEVFEAFAGVEHILHAGDVGQVELLDELEALAPVTAVWGNTDDLDVRNRVPEVARVELGGVSCVVLHGMQLTSTTPARAAAAYPEAGLVVFGHSHRPVVALHGTTLAVNPGSAGPRRFLDPVSVAVAELLDGKVSAEIITLGAERR